MNKLRPKSSIGLRANWTCAKCPATATTHQIANAAANAVDSFVGVILEPPADWTARGEQTFCPAHKPKRRAAA